MTHFLIPTLIAPRLTTSVRLTGLVATLGLSLSLLGCQVIPDNGLDAETTAKATPLTTDKVGAAQVIPTVIGKYASSDYDKRAEGYDWVTVDILADKSAAGSTNDSAEKIMINVQSRSDIKKPTCTYQGTASFVGQDTVHGAIFQHTLEDNSLVFYQIKEGVLTIDSTDKTALNYYCSGGATLAGEYHKVNNKA